MLLDCHHAVRKGSPEATDVPGRLATLTAEAERRTHWMPECVIAASPSGTTSASTNFGGDDVGAFTWAITSVLGQLQTTGRGRRARFDVTYEKILSQTKALLEAQSFHSMPVIIGRRDARFPYAPRLSDGPQFNPGLFVLTLNWYDGGGSLHAQPLAQVMATGNTGVYINGTRLPDFKEYWYVDKQVVPNLGSSTQNSIVISYTSLDPNGVSYTPPGYSQQESFVLKEDMPWNQGQDPFTPTASQVSTFFVGSIIDQGTAYTTYLQLVSQNNSGTIILKEVAWFVGTDPSTGYIIPNSTFTASSSGPSAPHNYYAIKQAAGG
jgi:hypothetical protein